MKVAAIIPAYDEESGIASVLEAVCASDRVDEVLVVNDGSTDDTAAVAAGWPRVRIVDLPTNRGKGAAMVAGARSTDADVVVFIDADLIGLQPRHVSALVMPVVEGDADMTVGVFAKGRFLTDLSQKLQPAISGQRAFRRNVFLAAPGIERAGYEVEVALTRYARRAGLREVRVRLDGVSQRMKEEKHGFLRGTRARMCMYGQILRYVLSTRHRHRADAELGDG